MHSPKAMVCTAPRPCCAQPQGNAMGDIISTVHAVVREAFFYQGGISTIESAV